MSDERVHEKRMLLEPWKDPEVQVWSQLLLDSFRRWLGRDLIDRGGTGADQARSLFQASSVVVSHGTGDDPVLNYGNQMALDLWGMSWKQFTQSPSRLTAEPLNQEERTRMLAQAATQGFIEDYRGVRISSEGRRFLVERATVWNVIDSKGQGWGQAATFRDWKYLDACERLHRPSSPISR